MGRSFYTVKPINDWNWPRTHRFGGTDKPPKVVKPEPEPEPDTCKLPAKTQVYRGPRHVTKAKVEGSLEKE